MAATASQYTPKTRIYLSGSLARKFFRFKDYQLDSGCANEGFQGAAKHRGRIAAEVARLARLGMRFAIFRNRKNVGEDGFGMGGARKIRIVPVIAGAKRAGILQTALGIALIVVGAYSQNPNLIAAGVAMTAGGVIQMLSPQASGLRQSGSPDNLPSYAFGSAKSTTASGNTVPICIGYRRWGGAIISASIYAEDQL